MPKREDPAVDPAANTAMFQAFAQRREAEDTQRPFLTPARVVIALAVVAVLGVVVGLLVA